RRAGPVPREGRRRRRGGACLSPAPAVVPRDPAARPAEGDPRGAGALRCRAPREGPGAAQQRERAGEGAAAAPRPAAAPAGGGGDLQERVWWLLGATCAGSIGVLALLYRRVRRSNHALESTNEQLLVQSERDPLTGLPNRRHFQAAMQRLAADGTLAGTVFLV